MQPRGTLSGDGPFVTLTFRRRYRHAIEHVWDAIATGDGMREWLMCTHAVIDGRVGGRIELVTGPPRYRSTGAILAWDPPRVLEYEWNVEPLPEMPAGERAIFRFELASETEGDGGRATSLVVTYRRMTRRTATGFLPGVHAFLDRLEAQLDGAPLPDWTERFVAIRDEYPEWREHATDAGQ